jgi:hypothetical protein
MPPCSTPCIAQALIAKKWIGTNRRARSTGRRLRDFASWTPADSGMEEIRSGECSGRLAMRRGRLIESSPFAFSWKRRVIQPDCAPRLLLRPGIGVSPERPRSVENDLELRVIAMPNRLLGQGTAANSLATYFSTSNNRRGTHRCLGLAPANRPLLTNLLVANVSAICNWVLTDKYLKSRQLNSRCFRSLLVAA